MRNDACPLSLELYIVFYRNFACAFHAGNRSSLQSNLYLEAAAPTAHQNYLADLTVV